MSGEWVESGVIDKALAPRQVVKGRVGIPRDGRVHGVLFTLHKDQILIGRVVPFLVGESPFVVNDVGAVDGFAVVYPHQIVGRTGSRGASNASLDLFFQDGFGKVVREDVHRIVHDPLTQIVWALRDFVVGCRKGWCGAVQDRGRQKVLEGVCFSRNPHRLCIRTTTPKHLWSRHPRGGARPNVFVTHTQLTTKALSRPKHH